MIEQTQFPLQGIHTRKNYSLYISLILLIVIVTLFIKYNYDKIFYDSKEVNYPITN